MLIIKSLKIGYRVNSQIKYVVNDISISIDRGEQIGIIGESGSGKSLTVSSIVGLYQQKPLTIEGQILFNGDNLLKLSEKALNRYRGNEIAMIFQDARSSLVPYLRIKEQLSEYNPFIYRRIVDKQKVNEACSILRDMNFTTPMDELEKYPNQLSGGEAQRINVMLTILKKPKLLIADEPTSSLDTYNADKISELISKVCRNKGISLIYISHNIGEVITITDKIYTFYKGNIIEEVHISKDKEIIFSHPYTRFLYEVYSGTAFKDIDSNKRINNDIKESAEAYCSYINQCKIYSDLTEINKVYCRKKQDLRKINNTYDKVACHIKQFEQ